MDKTASLGLFGIPVVAQQNRHESWNMAEMASLNEQHFFYIKCSMR